MQAIILVGGFGTRLRSVLADLPKPMAPIQNKPFLAHLLKYLHQNGITEVIFPIHYMGEKIRAYFQSHYSSINIQYIEEDQPLGTGGAIANSLTLIQNKQEPIFVLNGDTFLKLDYQAMYDQHQLQAATLTMALRQIEDCSRYGKVMTENKNIIGFKEKGEAGPGLINGGVYLISPEIFSSFAMPKQFSFETDFIFPHLLPLKPQFFMANEYFIDIGIPEDYARAQIDLPVFG